MNARPTPEGLMMRAIAGAITSAQEGDLPLFAWTLGLSQAALKDMIEQCFPELGDLEPVPPAQYAMFVEATPHEFHALLDLIGQHRSPDVPASHADWLARAIAVASFGDRHLWEDLGLSDRGSLNELLEVYFPTLSQLNASDMRWNAIPVCPM